MSDDFDFVTQGNEDPAAEFLARESEELGDLGEELGIASQPQLVVDEPSGDSFHNGGIPPHSPIPAFGTSSPTPAINPFAHREEPESIKKWRLEHEDRIRQRDEKELVQKEELREQAKKELAEWYDRYDAQLAKTKAMNREKVKDFVAEVDEIVPGTEWDRASKLCNFNVKSGAKHTKDVSRLKSIMLHLKKNTQTSEA